MQSDQNKKFVKFIILALCVGGFLLSYAIYYQLAHASDTLYDSYTTNDDNYQDTRGIYWHGQTFTASDNYTPTSIKLKLFKEGTPTEPNTVSIRATSGGLPTGADLCSGYLNPTTYTTNTNGEFYEFSMTGCSSLSSGTVYAIIERCVDCTNASNDVNWRMDYQNASYSGGKAINSTDSGSSWSEYVANTDMMFEVYGTSPNPVPVLSSMNPTSVYAGANTTTLTVYGSDFIATSVVKFNSNSLSTTYQSSTQMQAEIPKSYLTLSGTSSISVYTAPPSGGTSDSLTFYINEPTGNVLEQLDGSFDLGMASNDLSNGKITGLQTLGTGLEGTFNLIKLKIKDDIYLNQSIGFYESTACSPDLSDSTKLFDANATISATGTPVIAEYYTTSTTFDAEKCYEIYLGNDSLHVYGTTTNAYASGSAYWWEGGNRVATSSDFYFEFSQELPLSNSVSITTPSNGSTVSDFPYFAASYSKASSTVWGQIGVLYSTSSTLVENATSSGAVIQQLSEGTAPTGLYVDFSSSVNNSTTTTTYLNINKYTLLELGETYYAKAFLEDTLCDYTSYNCLIASSTLISFTINSRIPTVTEFEMPTSTASSSDWVITCDPNSGFFQNSFCNVLVYLFVPKYDDLFQYTGIYNDLIKKAPFGYFKIVKDGISGISTSTESAYSLPDLSSMDDTLFSPIKSGISILLWCLLGFWLFSRVRHIEL